VQPAIQPFEELAGEPDADPPDHAPHRSATIRASRGRPPLNPRQLLLVNFLTDVAPAIAVALRPPEPTRLSELAKEGPKTSLETALDRDIAARAIVTTAGATGAWFAGRLTGSRARASTIGLVALVGTQLGQTLTAGSRPLPVVLTSVGSAALLAGIVQTPGVSNFFGCRPLGPLGWATAVASSALAASSAPYVRQAIDVLVDRVPEVLDETTRRLLARRPA
jgi:magnesium-transporting ATPase (P-type)